MESSLNLTPEGQLITSDERDKLSKNQQESAQSSKPIDLREAEEEREIRVSKGEEEDLSTPVSIEGLKNFNKQLGNLADKLTAKGELNGLFLLGMGTQLLASGINLLTKEKIDQQEAGLSIIKRFQQILPEQIQGDSPKPVVWSDPNSGQKYRFEISGGESINVEGKKGKSPKVLRGVELTNGEEREVFLARKTEPDNRVQAWRIEQCDFSQGQIESLLLARRQIDEERSPINKTVQGANSFCL